MTETAAALTDSTDSTDSPRATQSARLWQGDGWTAQVIKNDDDDGWAVAMTQDGAREPALIGPWTMGRDKKNPKPFDGNAFITLVKTASEFVRRQEQQLHAALHQDITVTALVAQGAGGQRASARITVALDIEPDDDHPSAWLSATSESGDSLARVRVAPSFKLNRTTAAAWVEADFPKPKGD